MKRANKRGASEVFAYNAVVCDCDMHGEYTRQQTEAAADALRSALLDRGEISPSLFVRTGRGVQVWYLIKPLAASLGWLYEMAQDSIFEMVGAIIESEGLPFELDAAVKDAGRVVRLPGSWNYHIQSFGTYEIMQRERYAVQEIIEQLGKPQKKREKKTEKRSYKAGKYVPLCWKQKQTIEKLCRSRKSMQGLRNTALFLYAAAVFQLMDTESAADACRSLNSLHSMGLREREAESVINYYIRHGVEKHARKETFFDLLEMSAEEIADYNSGGAREAERQAARDRKAERNALIIKYHLQGYTKKQIAEAVGVARGTVYAVLKGEEIAEVVRSGKNGLRAALAFVRKLTAEKLEAVGSVLLEKMGFVFPMVVKDRGGGLCLSG
jgi:DNA-directed RNA polymerase specialized sigma24 family protein